MKKFSAIVMFALFVGAIFITPTTAIAAPKSSSNSLGVNPRRDYVVKPGEKIQDTLNVTNLDKSEPLIIAVRSVDFKASNQTGTPNLLLKQIEPTRWSLKPYLTIPATYTIPAGKSADVPFTINIPANVGAGSYYSAVHYSVSGGEGDQSTVNLSGSSVSLLFVRVSGEAKSSLLLQKFGAFTPSNDMTTGVYNSFYSATKPKYLSYTLQNKGNIAEQPGGSLQLKNIFGQTVKLYAKANPYESLVLLEQTRRIDLCLNEVEVREKNKLNGQDEEVKKCEDAKLLPGRYTAAMSLVYGGEGIATQEIRASTSFWYLPVWFIIAVIIGLLIAAWAIRTLVSKIKNRGKPTYGTRR